MPVSIEKAKEAVINPTPFDKAWFNFLGHLPIDKGWNCTVFGPSFHGKSTFALFFAMQCTMFGNVLYINAEEDTEKGTLKNKLIKNNIKAMNNKFDFADTTDIEEIDKLLKSGEYKYCVRDSIHAFAKWNQVKVLDLWMKFRDYPEVSFIDILFSTKDELNFKGESDMIHLSEFAIECKKNKQDLPIARMERKNRYKDNPNKNKYLDFIHRKIVREA
jgi:hypothetical protein